MSVVRRLARRHPLWLLPAALWAGVIWALSARPASAYHRVGPVAATRLPVPQAHVATVAHLVVYGTLAALLERGIPLRGSRSRAMATWIAASAYGVVDEIHQSRVDGRDASSFDVATDATGAALGIAGSRVVTRWLRADNLRR